MLVVPRLPPATDRDGEARRQRPAGRGGRCTAPGFLRLATAGVGAKRGNVADPTVSGSVRRFERLPPCRWVFGSAERSEAQRGVTGLMGPVLGAVALAPAAAVACESDRVNTDHSSPRPPTVAAVWGSLFWGRWAYSPGSSGGAACRGGGGAMRGAGAPVLAAVPDSFTALPAGDSWPSTSQRLPLWAMR